MTATAPRREVASRVVVEAPAPADFVLAVAVADGVPIASETLRVTLDGEEIGASELEDRHGTRLHRVVAGPGELRVEYAATVVGRAAPPPVEELDLVTYLRPSRYVPSDTLTPRARATFPGLAGWDAVAAVEDWVHRHLVYDGAASAPDGGAIETLAAGAGVCRDFAHVTAAFLRALDVPARIVGVYAPELSPPDFHAVVEAYADDAWTVVDATRLAPRAGLVRVATGRDAADIAFLTNTLADIELRDLAVSASIDATEPDDRSARVVLG